MTARLIKSMRWSFAGGVVMSVSMAAVSLGSHKSETIDIAAETASATPYAQVAWMKLAELVPTETDAPDISVRLITVEGKVLLPADRDR